ncbi:MAG TPA: acyltransferase, partial [Shewanella sp.]|nr:acyltransferase [Shewanella sp.]
PSDDIVTDMQEILSFYRTIKGRHPKVIPDFIASAKH